MSVDDREYLPNLDIQSLNSVKKLVPMLKTLGKKLNTISSFVLNLQNEVEVRYLTKSDFENVLFTKLTEFETSVSSNS